MPYEYVFVQNFSCIFLQGELIVGDQSGAIHMWDLRTDHNEQLVCNTPVSQSLQNTLNVHSLHYRYCTSLDHITSITNATSYYTTLYHTTPTTHNHTIPHYTTANHTTPHNTILHHTMHTTPYHTFHKTPNYTIPQHKLMAQQGAVGYYTTDIQYYLPSIDPR